MCGIVGCITINKISNDKIDKLNNLQYHRGPDGNGTYTEQIDKKNLTLLHQRLSIIDLSDGSQPMLDSKKELIIVFNGEIFNHMELKTKLKDKGYEFLTDHSDTEVLLYMYKEYKENMLDYLNGMFAFVIFDKKNKQLFGARDRTGIKPLYYSVKDKEFYFASELKTLLEFGLKKEIDFQSLSNYLSFQFVPSPKTIFKNISKLEAGNYFIFDIKNTKLDIRRFYKIEFNKTIKNEKDATAKIQKQFRDSINLWSMSDVEVGASLSGGLDSSAIVAMYSKISEKKIKTYSLGFEGNLKSLDERKYAKLVSEKYNTNHHEFVLTEDKLLSELDDMIYHLDEPYAGGLPSWYVYKMMKNDIKVSLTGTGGDELFGNYNKSLVYNSSLRKIKRFSNFSRGNFKNSSDI